jgi:hypothetical protein
LGAVAFAGIVAIALFPADRFGALHPIALAIAGVPTLVAAAFGIFAVREREWAVRVIGIAGWVVSVATLALYAKQLAGVDPGPAIATLERWSMLLVVAWMLIVACRASVITARERA